MDKDSTSTAETTANPLAQSPMNQDGTNGNLDQGANRTDWNTPSAEGGTDGGIDGSGRANEARSPTAGGASAGANTGSISNGSDDFSDNDAEQS
ncbi:MAG TPA: hypothetical protein VEX38_08795 [Fimbriimonadaceae bacterium]|nr:hypothetical protein [Fimbriimonadaceae bacterium]